MAGGGPQGTGTTWTRPKKKRRRPPPPTKRQVANAVAQQRQFVSQGRAVEKVANRKNARAKQRRVTAPGRQYVSQGKAVEKVANTLRGQTRRVERAQGRKVDVAAALLHFLSGPARAQTGTGGAKSRGLPGGTFAQQGLVTPGSGPYKIGKDALGLPKNAVVGGYETARAVNDLAGYLPGAPQKGSTVRAKRLIGGLDEGFLGRLLVHGDVKGAGKAFAEHPLFSALEVAGAGQVLGRVAGAGARVGLAGRGMRGRANTRRAPLRYGPGKNQEVDRSFSPNLLVQEVQRASDRAKKRQGYDPNQARGQRQSRLLNDQVDEFAAKSEGARRRGREETARAGAKVAPVRYGAGATTRRGKAAAAADRAAQRSSESASLPTRAGRARVERNVVLAAVEGRLHGPKTFKADLLHERDRLQKVYVAERKTWSAATRQANRAQVKALDRVIHDPKALGNADEVFRAAEDYKQVGGKIEKDLIAQNALDSHQALASKVRPYAVAHMDARHDPTLRAPEEMAARHGAARDVETTAREDVDKAQKNEAKAKAKLDRLVGAQASRRGRRMRDDKPLAAAKSAEDRRLGAHEWGVENWMNTEVGRGHELIVKNGSVRAALQATHPDHGGSPKDFQAVQAARKAGATSAKSASEELARVRAARRANAERGPAATKAEQAKLAKARAAHDAAKTERRAAEARFKQSRRDRVKSNPKTYATGLVDGDGHPISTAQIIEHMRANPDHGGGPGELNLPGFVSHRRDTKGARSFFVNWFDRRQGVDAKRRTGEATRTGGHAADFRALEEHLVRGRGVTDAIRTFDEFAKDIGVKRSNGRHYTWEGAQKIAGDMQEAHGIEMVPLRVVPAKYDAATRQRILDRQGTADAPQELDSLVQRRLDEALREPPAGQAGAENVVLVPAQQLKRFREHQTTGSSVGAKLGQALSRAFRGTVLPFSTKWLLGNVAEAIVRLAVNGIGPGDILIRGPKIMAELKRVDLEKYKALDDRARNGLLYGSGDRLNVYRDASDFEGTVLATPAQALAISSRLPVVRQLLTGLRAYQRAVFAVNRGMEKALQTGVIGKAARKDAQELTGSWIKAQRMQEDVVKEVASGLLGTPKQVRLARQVDEILGKYGRFSPSTRRAIQTYAPFLPWYLNAAKFVFYTLPAKHPAKTALLASVETTLAKDIQETHRDAPPGDLESAIRTKDGGYVPLARFTPFGAFTNLPDAAVDPLLPQISSVTQILQGKSWTGKELRTQSGETVARDKRVWLALYAMAEGTVPGLAIARRLQEGGKTAFDDSTVLSPKTKPGSSYGTSAVNRVLNPLRPTYLAPPGGGGEEVVVGNGRAAVPRSNLPASVQRAAHGAAHARRSAIPDSVQRALRGG